VLDIYNPDSKIQLHPNYTNQQVLRLLQYFLTHTDGRAIYGLKNLPSEFIGALFAKYSRSSKTIVEVLLDFLADADVNFTQAQLNALSELENKLIGSDKAANFHKKYVLNWGHDSIGKMVNGINIAIDRCSILAAQYICDTRIGFQCIERSTRYQKKFFDVDNIIDPARIFTNVGSEEVKLELCDGLKTMSKVCIEVAELVYKYLKDKLIEIYPYDERAAEDNIDKSAWRKWINNRALDNARYLLPVVSSTGLGISVNSLACNNLINKLYNFPSNEFQLIAKSIYEAASVLVPTLIQEPSIDPILLQQNIFDKDIAKMREYIISSVYEKDRNEINNFSNAENKVLIDTDERRANSEEIITLITCTILSTQLNIPTEIIYQWFVNWVRTENMPKELLQFYDLPNNPAISPLDFCLKIIYKFIGQRDDNGNIINERAVRMKNGKAIGWHKLPRFFERINLTFDLVTDFGSWRDLNRHSLISKISSPLLPDLGYSLPDDYDLLPEDLQKMVLKCYTMSVEMFDRIVSSYKDKSKGLHTGSYAALNMWNQRKLVTVNLRELDYIITLRTKWTGHFAYRRIAQLMYYRTIELWPLLSKIFRIDKNYYVFGRIRKIYKDGDKSKDNEG